MFCNFVISIVGHFLFNKLIFILDIAYLYPDEHLLFYSFQIKIQKKIKLRVAKKITEMLQLN
jgi:hypothetical protein